MRTTTTRADPFCVSPVKDYKSSAKLAKQKDCKMQGLVVKMNFLTPDETMKIRFLLAIVGLALGFAPPTFAQQTDTPDPQLRQMIDEFAKKYAEAVNNNDASALAAFYTEDGVFVTTDGPKYGRAAILKFYADLFRQFHFSNYSSKADQYSPRLIGTDGSETLEIGEWSCTVEGHDGSPIQLRGYYSSIDIRKDGGWKIRTVTSNTIQ